MARSHGAQPPASSRADVPRVEIAPGVAEDFERILDHLASHEVDHLGDRVRSISKALDILTHSPDIGRPARGGLRELVIGRGSRGYVALYRHVNEVDTVFVLALRAQREAGYRVD